MKKIIKKFFIFCIVGGLSFLVDIIFLNLFFWLGLSFIISRTFSITLALLFNFIMNRNLTFSALGKPLKLQVPKYLIVYVFANLVNLFVSVFLVTLLGESYINVNLASVVGVISAIPFSFLGSNLWTFRR